MNKENLRWFIIGAAIVALLAAIFWVWTKPANATFTPPTHKVWQTTYGDWSQCTPKEEYLKLDKVSDEIVVPTCGQDGVKGHQWRWVTKTCTTVFGYGQNECQGGEQHYKQWRDCETTPPPCDVSPTPTPEAPGPNDNKGPASSTDAPVCSDGSTVQLPANLHVIRNGSSATVNFFITEGDHANIYWKVLGQPNWQYAVSDIHPGSDNYVSYTIGSLDPNLGYEFGVQQAHGCGGGGLVTAVVVDGPQKHLFRFSFWTW